jgi:hypothetical protein
MQGTDANGRPITDTTEQRNAYDPYVSVSFVANQRVIFCHDEDTFKLIDGGIG